MCVCTYVCVSVRMCVCMCTYMCIMRGDHPVSKLLFMTNGCGFLIWRGYAALRGGCGSIQKEGVFFVKRGYTFQEEG